MPSIKNDQNEDLVVSTRNVNLILKYCAKRGFSEEALISGLGYPAKYLKDADGWIPLPIFQEITKRARRFFDDDPTIFYEMGLVSTTEGGLGALEILKRAMAYLFADPRLLIKKVPEYNSYFNRTKEMEMIDLKPDSAILKIRFYPSVDSVYDFNSGPLVKGVIASIPTIWKLPPADVSELMLEYDVVRLLREHFSIFAEMKEGQLLIEGQIYGKEVELEWEQTAKGLIYLGKYKEIRDGEVFRGFSPRGVLITRGLNYKKYPLLMPGQIYNAPYFILKAAWKNPSVLMRLRQLLPLPFFRGSDYLEDLEKKTTDLQNYARALEESVIERNKMILEEKLEIERLKNELSTILASQLPPDLVHAMTTHRLEPKRNWGIVLFADLVGFSKRAHAAEDFASLFKDLNRFFDLSNACVKSRGGWVYKYLGDAIMAVFGGYRENENYLELAEKSIEASQKIVQLVNEMGWKIRIGIEYGDFIAGEIGPSGDRVWDFLGETVNFAFRLGQHAEPNEILLGPNIIELMKRKITCQEKNIFLKGMGEQKAFTLVRFSHEIIL